MQRWIHVTTALALGVAAGCGSDGPDAEPIDPDTAPVVSVDRFSEEAGTLFVRTAMSGLPEANAPVDFDQPPFITRGLSADGDSVRYYNFDVMPLETAPIFVLVREGESDPVAGQLNIIDVIPGDAGYSDFWHVHRVTVPADYVANTITSVDEIMAGGYAIQRTTTLVNCPVVPVGSTATLRYGGGATGTVRGWFQGQVVHYFDFSEAPLQATLPEEGHPTAPVSPIYVMFEVNPDPADPESGPASGFRTEADGEQTHNVVETLPGDAGYSPLWMVNILDNAAFDSVVDLESASDAPFLAVGPNVNCPIVDAP